MRREVTVAGLIDHLLAGRWGRALGWGKVLWCTLRDVRWVVGLGEVGYGEIGEGWSLIVIGMIATGQRLRHVWTEGGSKGGLRGDGGGVGKTSVG
jgi:hypothetical protein